ncbi:phosphotransferase family protein [Streptoalloteichus hindustanus]|uniref:Phosphotransferase enzyme family protein n=1 Tax=Streptoalloteichus hindustanus TaxID=2017 RepID=A0A1M5B0K1_STRHI|nr:phosphotransferase [Streptoalloteichus hindustanus]SHF35983.1 Phosphotransferase enzyme family protein [Streptoalloteichus hindustanus]
MTTTYSAPSLLAGMAALAGRWDGPAPVSEPVVLAERADVLVVRVGDVVVKAHRPGMDPAALRARLSLAASPALRGIVLPPVLPAGGGPGVSVVDGRLVTVWPLGRPVEPAGPVPWEEAGRLLAALHRVPLPALDASAGLPRCGAAARLARTMRELERVGSSPAVSEIRRAHATLPRWAWTPADPDWRGAEGGEAGLVLVHGDWHLGQLVRRADTGRPAGEPGWLLIDVDDLGLGTPSWDLGRIAAWQASGLLPPDVWERFLAAYRGSGGPAVSEGRDPWPAVDVAARAYTVQSAAVAVLRAGREGRAPDEVDSALVDACRRIADLHRSG